MQEYELDHERLDVYQVAKQFVILADQIVSQLPKGRAYLADQLQRVAISIPLNIAEGAGEFSKREKSRSYRIAKRSAMECAAILDVCHDLGVVAPDHALEGRQFLGRLVAMLVRISRLEGDSGRGTGRGPGSSE